LLLDCQSEQQRAEALSGASQGIFKILIAPVGNPAAIVVDGTTAAFATTQIDGCCELRLIDCRERTAGHHRHNGGCSHSKYAAVHHIRFLAN
jgi:hypothetical protein